MRVCTHIIPGPHCRSRICLMPKHGYPSNLFLSPMPPPPLSYRACDACVCVQRSQSAGVANISKIPTTHPNPSRRCSCHRACRVRDDHVWKALYVVCAFTLCVCVQNGRYYIHAYYCWRYERRFWPRTFCILRRKPFVPKPE